MNEFAGDFPRRIVCLRPLGGESKVEAEAVIGEGRNDLTSSVPEEQPTVEDEVCQR